MAIVEFPSIDQADEEGLLAIGGDMEVPSLLLAYSQGIFPWPIGNEVPLAWFAPDPRGIISIDNIHLPKSFKKFLNKTEFRVSFNQDFERVIIACANATNRKEQNGTWITPELIDAFIHFFYAGYAYSVEVWDQKRLVGGMYGVKIGKYFTGESMFYLKDNASKLALYSLLERLKNLNVSFLDTQMVTPIVESLGGVFIPRSIFMKLHKEAISYVPPLKL